MSPQTPTPPAPPVAPEAPFGAQAPATLSGLQAQATQLEIQLAGLRAQWSGLREQLDNMLRNNPARPGVQQKWADVGVQKAGVEGDLARVRAEIAQRTGVPGTPGADGHPPRPSRFNGNVGFPIGAVVFLVMLFPVSVAWAKRVARGAVNPRPTQLSREATERLERMEQAIDAVAIEVERISEGQRFVTKILAERPARAAQKAAASNDAPSAPQVLALGAGPAEMLQVGEREQVREQARPQ